MYKERIKEKWWFSQCGRTWLVCRNPSPNLSWTPLCDFKCRPWAKNSSPNTNDISRSAFKVTPEAPTPDIVADLIKNYFSRHFCRQKRITEKGRTTPKPNSLTKACKVFMRHFKDCNYIWGANTEHKLFCWPCLLFNSSKGTWNERPMGFIYKWQLSALLFDEYCIMHIVMEVYVVRWYCGAECGCPAFVQFCCFGSVVILERSECA